MDCSVCGTSFEPSGRRRYCSDGCRQAAWRHRHATPPAPATNPRRDTVYQCPACDTRYLHERRCPDCNLFCPSLGPGALCPHCDDPVAINDLLPDNP